MGQHQGTNMSQTHEFLERWSKTS